MGVTLERVQNKFACIIGELCNEPYVLSQFAIWVDLRIAEYKANGAIQLDCTGSKPEPSWLKGMDPPKSIQSDSLIFTPPPGSTNRSPANRFEAQETKESWGQNSSCEDLEIVEIKEERQEFSNSFSSPGSNFHRKRHEDDNASPETFSSNPSKSRRLSGGHLHETNNHSQQNEHNATNQSLLSLIEFPNTIATEPQNIPNSEEEMQPPNYEVHVPHGTVVSPNRYEEFSNSVSMNSRDSESHLSEKPSTHSLTKPTSNPPLTQQVKSRQYTLMTTWRNIGRPPITAMAENTVANTHSAVGIFQRWLTLNCPDAVQKYTSFEKIPPEKLDEILSIFWPSVKKHDGTDYRAQSLVQLRTRLERHLRAHRYPKSIIKSTCFQNSQSIFKERISLPSENENLQTVFSMYSSALSSGQTNI